MVRAARAASVARRHPAMIVCGWILAFTNRSASCDIGSREGEGEGEGEYEQKIVRGLNFEP